MTASCDPIARPGARQADLPLPPPARRVWVTHCPCGLTMAECRMRWECPEEAR